VLARLDAGLLVGVAGDAGIAPDIAGLRRRRRWRSRRFWRSRRLRKDRSGWSNACRRRRQGDPAGTNGHPNPRNYQDNPGHGYLNHTCPEPKT
jgi:hypothetical protein